MVMPEGYRKTYSTIPYGVWSDDGSQLLALLAVLIRGRGQYDETRFAENLLAWWRTGRFQAGGVVFDVGGQTRAALEDRAAARSLRPLAPARCGNGSLTRVLAAPLLPEAFGVPHSDAVRMAMDQSSVTHPQALARVSCALYVELCWTLAGRPDGDLWGLVMQAEETLRGRGILDLEERDSLRVLMAGRKELPTGSGYVVSTFWAAVWAVNGANSISETLRAAVGLGGDTDTVACVAGGLAGLRFGLDQLAERWWSEMDLCVDA